MNGEVYLGSPVCGHVLLDVARAADGLAGVIEVHGEVEAIAAAQDVDMVRNSAGLGDGVGALVVETAAATNNEGRLSGDEGS